MHRRQKDAPMILALCFPEKSMKLVVFILVLINLLFGCQHNESKDEVSPLVGQWLTDACTQVSDLEGNPINQWAKGIYRFQSSGEIFISSRLFSDSSCSGLFEIIEPANSKLLLTYDDLGIVTLEEGIEGGKIRVNFNDDEEIIVIVDGFYHVDGMALCFSDNLNLEPNIVSTSEAEFATIDFEKCLSKLN